MRRFTIVCDIDGILCSEEKTFDRWVARPYHENICKLNELHHCGHFIIIFTSRGWAEYKMTQQQLKDWGVRYDVLICGKPHADIIIDDRAINNLEEAFSKCQTK